VEDLYIDENLDDQSTDNISNPGRIQWAVNSFKPLKPPGLKNETGHKLDFKYTGPYKVESIEENDNTVISKNKNKKQTVH